MPKVFGADEMKVEKGEGWTRILLANPEIMGEDVMVAEQWEFSPFATGPEQVQGEVNQLLYVIGGRGVAMVNGEQLELEPESILWLEPGERYHFRAGDQGMQILQGYTSVEKS